MRNPLNLLKRRSRPMETAALPTSSPPAPQSDGSSSQPSSASSIHVVDEILGINLRNAIIAKYNPRQAIERARDKVAAKVALVEAGVKTSGTIAVVSGYGQLSSFDPEKILPDAWCIKPARGSQGEGILLAVRKEGRNWLKGSGTPLTPEDVQNHVRRIVDGQFSGDSASDDAALIEPLIRADPGFAFLVDDGLPDVRVICRGTVPLMAMARFPTNESDGKANLHQGGIGAGVNLETGMIFRAKQGKKVITHHPDTGQQLIGFVIPHWKKVLDIAAHGGPAVGLGYCGVDIVHDVNEGPMVIEVNAHPGIEIQNTTLQGLRGQLIRAGEKC